MSAIELARVSRRWGNAAPAVDNISFEVPNGQFVVLLGPSGCGKSTTLRLIAGLESVSSGRIFIGGEDVTTLPPSARRISMVFQSYALFPHLSVAENIVFGLKVRRVPAAERATRLAKVAELVGLAPFLERKPGQLSGGQRQRVALARAIVAENAICLMDEPLSNLDAKLRNAMRVEIRALQRRIGMTVVYVTHDQTEAMSMADKVVVIRDGRIDQEGSPDDIYNRPATTFVAQFVGTPPMNLFDPFTDGARAGVAAHPLVADWSPGCRFGVRPEHMALAPDGVPARVISGDYLGADSVVEVDIGGQPAHVRVAGHAACDEGDVVHVAWSPADVHVFDAATGVRIDGE
jgi:sn-glycerol 3-phosphate transport system ATP-binding protein